MVGVRLADLSDIPGMIDMLKRCFDEMDFKSNGYSFDRDSCVSTLQFVIGGGGFVIVNDEITAIFGVFNVPSFMDYADHKMTEFVFHTDPLCGKFKRARLSKQLLSASEKETRKRGISRLHVSASCRIKDASAFLTKSGYTAQEISFSKEV